MKMYLNFTKAMGINHPLKLGQPKIWSGVIFWVAILTCAMGPWNAFGEESPQGKDNIGAPQSIQPIQTIEQTTQTSPSWGGPTLADLEKLRSENAMLTEQFKNAELKNKIAGQGGLGNAILTSTQSGPHLSIANRAPNGPVVMMIAGAENQYRANMGLINGQTITVSVGSLVPGHGVVSAITPNAVILGSGKSKRSLPLIGNGANADFVMAP